MITRHTLMALALVGLCTPAAQAVPVPQRARAKASPAKKKRTKKAASKYRSMRRTYWRSLVYRLRVPNAAYQRRIGRELRRRSETRALPYILGMLRKRKQLHQRQGALRALGQLQLSWTLPLIMAHLRDPGTRPVALEALGSFCANRACKAQHPNGANAEPQVIQRLVTELKRGNSATTKVVLRALSAMDAPKALAAVQAMYKSSKKPPGTGLWYSRALATLGDPAKRAKWAKLTTTRTSWTGQRLSRWPGKWAAEIVAKGLSSPVARRRVQAAKWLLRYPHPARASALQSACQRKALSQTRCRRILRWTRTKALPFPAKEPPLFLLTKAQAKKAHAALSKQSPRFARRLERISRRMLGTPYILGPLGEGKKGRYDRDPIFTLKRVDCVTFIEQVIGLTHVGSLPKAIRFTQSIRYDKGRIDYRYRRHLPIAQWIPAMIRMGIGRDITRQVGGTKTSTLRKTLNARSYTTREGRILQTRLGKERVVMGNFQLPYLTHDLAIAQEKRIPSGTVLSSLRGFNPRSPGQVTHQGLLIRRKGVLYMRHASSLWRSVVDVPLRTYLKRLKNYPRPRIGIHLLQLLPRPTR